MARDSRKPPKRPSDPTTAGPGPAAAGDSRAEASPGGARPSSREARGSDSTGVLGAPMRLAAALRNAVDIARLGRLEQVEKTPYEVVLRESTFRLRRYGHDAVVDAPPIVLVPPLMLTSEVYDIAPGGSAVAALLAMGAEPWVVDFGAPERQEGALERTLADHVLAVSRAVDHVRKARGRDVHLAGYSQGGIFAYLAAAYRRSAGLATVITFGTPVNVHENVLPGIPDEVAVPVIEALGSVLSSGFARSAIPAWMTRNAFRLMSPTKELQNQLEFLRSLHDRDAIARREGQRRFLADEGWVAWPGPAFRELIEQMIQGNRLFSGGFVVEGAAVTLADITVPVLAFVGASDDIARPPTVRSVGDAAPRATLWECEVEAGHMGLVVGSRAMAETWPAVVDWMRWNDGHGEKPEAVERLGSTRRKSPLVPLRPTGAATATGGVDSIVAGADGTRGVLDMVSDLGRAAASLVVEAAGEGAEAVTALGATLARQLPRIARLEGLRRDSRVGLAMALSEQAAASPEGTFFLYEGRAHTFAAADARVDAIVRGLLHIGVRAGENVGVLMGTRPTALAVVAAVNRLGAVAVMLRPDGDLAAELALGAVEHLVADPDHAGRAAAAFAGTVHVLGGVHAEGRMLPRGAVDMEKIDPAAVPVPEWYEPSPGLAGDVAFVFFAGRGKAMRANRITNRRWALSAFGTASAASLGQADTVYAWTPIQHPTGLLVSMSAALVAGSRLAMAQGFRAATFWDEVRRYGASVVFYTGMMLREIVDAPRDPAERRHPVRLFAGSGMPRVLWRRLIDRFGPVGILEFYASTEGTAILANVSGRDVGSVGRPLPGSAEVRLVAWDMEAGEPLYDASGYARAAATGAAGMMLARIDREKGVVEGKFLRNVFERGDAWSVTGSFFVRDGDGRHWFVDHVGDFIRGEAGFVASVPIEDAAWELPWASAAAAYNLGGRPAVAVVLRDGASFDADSFARQVAAKLDEESRPVVVRVVGELPVTAGYRVQKGLLRAAGIPAEDVAAGLVFAWDAEAGRYVCLEPGAAAPRGRGGRRGEDRGPSAPRPRHRAR